jgi:hypothetical protein
MCWARASRLIERSDLQQFQAATPAGAETRNATPLRLGSATPRGDLSGGQAESLVVEL